ncbi:MAG: succinate dehydrogenase assembly factor 4 [Steroidobacteraceae bacterium]
MVLFPVVLVRVSGSLSRRILAEWGVMLQSAEMAENHRGAVQPETQSPEGVPAGAPGPQPEIGGPPGPDPVRFGDWEKNGRCIDF